MPTFQDRREKFSALYEAIKLAHQDAPRIHRGHGFDHDVTVAEMGAKITDDPQMQEMVWAAAMVHSLDRMFPKESFEDKIREHLVFVNPVFTGNELFQIFEAARDHGKLNDPLDAPVTIRLKDADRLSNAMVGVIIRSGQFHPGIPAMDLYSLGEMNPMSTYQLPQSVVDDLRYCLEWEEMLRAPEAKVLGAPLFAELRRFFETLSSQYEMIGLNGIEL